MTEKEHKSEHKTIKIPVVRVYQIVIVALALALVGVIGLFGAGITGCAVANPKSIAEDSMQFMRTNLLDETLNLELISAEKSNGMYLISARATGSYMGQNVNEVVRYFVSSDGKMLFFENSAIDMSMEMPSQRLENKSLALLQLKGEVGKSVLAANLVAIAAAQPQMLFQPVVRNQLARPADQGEGQFP